MVTNDNDIIRRASGVNCSCLSVDEFIRLVENIIAHDASGGSADIFEDGDEAEYEDGISGRRGSSGGKKGNPRRLSKKERLKMKKIKKL